MTKSITEQMPLHPDCPLKWENASMAEFVLLEAMQRLFSGNPGLLTFVFHPKEPRLRRTPGVLLKEARRLSSGETLLVRVALDLWNQSGSVGLFEIIERLDSGAFENVTSALRMLGPKPATPWIPQLTSRTRPDEGWQRQLF